MSEPTPPSENQYVSTAQVARVLGVSVTTVKRWVDDDILPAHRTAGGHRKLLSNDVLRLVREGNFPLADLTSLLSVSPALATNDTDEIYRQLTGALDDGNAELVRSIIHGAHQRGMPIETLSDFVIGPAMGRIGHLWETGRIGVMEEHRATQMCVGALYELRALLRMQLDRERRPVALGGAPEHDHYILPSLLAKLVLLDCGWNAINLGPHTPMQAFQQALEELRPQLIWMTVSHLADPQYFLTKYREFFKRAEKAGVPIAVGGRGLSEGVRAAMPYTTFGDGLTHLASFAKSLHRQPQRPRRGRPPSRAAESEPEAEPAD